MYTGIIASVLLACLVCQATSQIEPSARNMAPHDVHVTFQDNACDREFSEASFKANVYWQSPRISRPVSAYFVHVITASNVHIKIQVDATYTRRELDLACWSAYVLRVEALYQSGESAFSDALFVPTEKQNSKLLPQALTAIDVGKTCKNGAGTTSVKLSWKPAHVGSFNFTGYTVIVTPEKDSRKITSLGKYDYNFKYDGVSCEGTTFFSVNARALVSFGLPDSTLFEIGLPAAYAVFANKSKAYVVPAPSTTTIATPETEGYSTASESHSSATPGQVSTTEQPHEVTTHFNEVEPASSGLSTSSILCIVLIPLAVILLAVLLFFGYKKFKQGGEGLLSTADSP